MSDFNINGGYFAPLGYAKVEAGGSHEENPNGGVQLGADAQGVPNLLEEGEIVFNDFVYSDNIHAEGGMLEKHNLPKNYSGKLYSDIADDMINNAAPGDNIAMNGLKKFLLRLAEAQEEQKSIKEQEELAEELSQLSPEELQQLYAMTEQQGQLVDMEVPQEQVNPEVIAPEQIAAPANTVAEQQAAPMLFKKGGLIGNDDEDYDYKLPPSPYNAFSYKGMALNNFAPTDYTYWPQYGVLPAATVVADRKQPGNIVANSAVSNAVANSAAKSASTNTGVARDLVPLERLAAIEGPGARKGEALAKLDAVPVGDSWRTGMLAANRTGSLAGAKDINEFVKSKTAENGSGESEYTGALPTWMRYAGIGVNLASLLHNLGEEPTRYELPTYNPALPTGEVRVVPQEYRAVDPNMVSNAVLAQGNATQRAIRNSGMGPSVMSGLLASDYNLTNAVGNALNTGWSDANARRNAVIAANNGAEASRASFDFGVSNAQANNINNAEQLRARYFMLKQQLDNAEDAAQAQAISTQLDAVAKALSNIGNENFIMNQVNSNDALYYSTGLNGMKRYKGPFGFLQEYV